MTEPTLSQLALLILSIVFFVIGGGLSLARLRSSWPRLRIAAKACLYFGMLAALATLVWHSISRGSWLPLEDNFDALIWLALLLVLFVLYVQRHRPIGGLDWFIMPIVVLLLIGAAVVGRAAPHGYVDNAWAWFHRLTAYSGAVAFAVAGASGAMYLVNNRRLRSKSALPGPNLGSLERLEHLTLVSVTLGFALLTLGAITGILEMRHGHRTPVAKLVLASCVWVVYAIVLHAPINPSFRGKKVAVLSVVGFVLVVGTMLAVLFIPGGAR